MSARNQTVVIVGQGYVGLPVAMRAVEVGYDVIGIDVDVRRSSALQEGRSYVEDVPDAQVRRALASGQYVATDCYDSLVEGFDIAVITVPTPLRDAAPDLSYVEQSAASLAEHLRPGGTIILESTTYPGTTDELVLPILERVSGLTAGRDFHLGYSPERIDPGNATWGFVETPKVVSGIDAASLERVQDFYGALVDTTVPVSGTREAELTKLLENTFRHVNIALVNELAVFADLLGVDVWESIDAAATKPFGFMKFTPGPGVGGHCLPVDPSYLSWQVKRSLGRTFRFVELANDVNDHMPDHVVERIAGMLNDAGRPVRGSRILLAGLAYKKNSGDTREAPSARVIELLTCMGAELIGVDAHVEDHRWPTSVIRADLTPALIPTIHAAIVLTEHEGVDLELLRGIPTLDTRNTLGAGGSVVVL
ncbi:nucleotide sugar dehydrogenase [Curtobacterium sp. PhB136]|uniref:nucleotide sugar dehydrogenase n=1 Tax=Curtobacterium sp. PhB136 TaxID=2485181 RepID=UPI001042F270|nr:nucleotide sugar dehydrogenase [Curtobacterium sp. PhB136]TCK65426.1 UDP-N-acetyl-D-glucosamine dehydrogenase [Curtobacterium sp. PhB136]